MEIVPQIFTAKVMHSGKLQPLTQASLRRAFWKYPLVKLKTIMLIHWQALKLLAKGIHYIPKPLQLPAKFSTTRHLTKM